MDNQTNNMQGENQNNSSPTAEFNLGAHNVNSDSLQHSTHQQDVSLTIENTLDGINRDSSLSANYLMLIESSPQEQIDTEDGRDVFEIKDNNVHSDLKPRKTPSTSSYLTPSELNSQKEPKRDNSTSSYLTPAEVAQIKETNNKHARSEVSVSQNGSAYKKHNYANGSLTSDPKRQGSSDSYDYHDYRDWALPKVPPVPRPKTEREYSKQISSYTDDSGLGDDYHFYQKPDDNDVDPEYDYINHGDDISAVKKYEPLPPPPAQPGNFRTERTPKRTSYKRRLCYICIGVSIVLVLAVVGVLAYFVIADEVTTVTPGISTETLTPTETYPTVTKNKTSIATNTTLSSVTVSDYHTTPDPEIETMIPNEQQLTDADIDDTTVQTTPISTNVISSTSTTRSSSTTTTTPSSTSITVSTSTTSTPSIDSPGGNNCSTSSTTSNECKGLICDEHTAHYKNFPDPRNIALWYHDIVLKHAYNDTYEAYFIKVLVISNKIVPVKTVNRVGTMSVNRPEFDFSVKPGDLYGTRITCSQTQVVCVEFKKGGQFSDGINPEYEDYPVIELSVEDLEVTYTVEPNENIAREWTRNNKFTYSMSHNKFTFHMPYHETIYQSWSYGVFRSKLQYNATEARRIGREECEEGSTWAVRFTAT